MKTSTAQRLFLAGAMALGLSLVTPGLVRADRDRDNDESIEMRDAPHDVRRTIEEHSHDNKPSALYHVWVHGHEFYRAIVRVGDNRVRDIRVAPDGSLMGEDTFNENEWRDREREHYNWDRH